jgi:hypothetical protein
MSPLDLYVARRPPTARHFLSQRVRQAYDDFALPARLVVELSVLPVTAAAIARRRFARLGVALAAVAAIAEAGRRRAGGAEYFPASASLLAPAWMLERGLSAWLAVGLRVTRGSVGYSGGRVALAATPTRRLRRERRPAAA